jgi:hypothetical protein
LYRTNLSSEKGDSNPNPNKIRFINASGHQSVCQLFVVVLPVAVLSELAAHVLSNYQAKKRKEHIMQASCNKVGGKAGQSEQAESTYVSVRDPLGNPHSAGASIVGTHVEHPSLIGVNDSEGLPALALGGVTAGPVGGVETQILREFAHDLNRLAGSLGSLQGDLTHLGHFDTGLAAVVDGECVQLGSTGGLTDGHLMLVHDAIAGLNEGIGLLNLYIIVVVRLRQ